VYAGDANLYRYVENKGIIRVDPDGNSVFPPVTGPWGGTAADDARRAAERWEEIYKKFMEWLSLQPDTTWADSPNLPDCPCDISRTKFVRGGTQYHCIGPGTVVPDRYITVYDNFPADWALVGSFSHWFVDTFVQVYHPGAAYDLRTKDPTKYGGHGQQCTYDKNGKLITHGPGAGTPDFGSPNATPNVHKKEDYLPYDWCLELDGGKPGKYCEMYRTVRPPNQGKDNNNKPCPTNP
jgi:hypothetical protein